MDGYSLKLWLGIGAVVLLVFLWIVWKFFFKLLKHFIIILILGAIFAGVYWYRSLPPPKNPSIGKHAYLIENGKYLGVIEGEGEDDRRGAVWNIRFPGAHPRMFSKTRVTVKDKRDIASEPTPEPSATPTPAAKTKPAAVKK